MRRSGLAAVIISGLLVVACSEQPTAPTERPTTPPPPSFSVACSPPYTTCIQGLITALFRPGDNLKSANSYWTNIQTKFNQGLKGRAAAQAKAGDLVNYGLKSFYANKLLGGMTQGTVDNLVALNDAVYAYTLLTNAPTIPPDALQADAAAVIITPQSPTTLVLTDTKQAGAIVPAGAAPMTILLTIRRLDDSPGPLHTSLDQYPLFYHFATSPVVTFNLDVTNGICQSGTFDLATFNALRIAHNVDPLLGDPDFAVEILPRVNAPFLDCSNADFSSLEHGGLIGFASAGWSLLGRTVGPVATAILLPDELHAAALEACCIGGTLKKYSDFGAVDPRSNPGATLGYNPDAATFDDLSAPAGTAVTPAPSVVVKSKNGTPIANVPVVFAVGEEGGTVNGGNTATVSTNASGIATVTTWILGTTPGTYTLSATPPAVAKVGGPAEPFRPAATFAPPSLTFTATATATPPFGFEAGEAAWAPSGFWDRNTLSDLSNSAYDNFVSTFDADDVPGGTLPAPFAGSHVAWYGQPATGNYIGTQVTGDNNNSGGTSTLANSGTFLSPPFRVPDISGAVATFQTWWEIESVNAATFDLMEVVVLDATGTTELGRTRLNPESDPPEPAPSAPYTSAGFNTAPTWEQIVINLSARRGQIVRLRFDFNTIDELYNGFRGWIVDQVQVPTGEAQVTTFAGPSVRLGASLLPSRKLVPVDRATLPPARERR